MKRWSYLRLPAIADSNEDKSDPTKRKLGAPLSAIRPIRNLESLRKEDPLRFAGLFQGTPRPAEGRFFKREDFRIRGPWDAPEITRWYRAWDLATSVRESADFTAGALIGVAPNLDIWIRDLVRVKKEFPDARELIIETALADGPDVPIGIEQKVAGLAMVQDLLRVPELRMHAIHEMPARGDKKQRAQGWAARARAGHLYLVRGDWTHPFVNEALSFDGLGSVHDDQIDAVSIGWALLHMLQGEVSEKKPLPRPGSARYYEALRESLNAGEDEDNWSDDDD